MAYGLLDSHAASAAASVRVLSHMMPLHAPVHERRASFAGSCGAPCKTSGALGFLGFLNPASLLWRRYNCAPSVVAFQCVCCTIPQRESHTSAHSCCLSHVMEAPRIRPLVCTRLSAGLHFTHDKPPVGAWRPVKPVRPLPRHGKYLHLLDFAWLTRWGLWLHSPPACVLCMRIKHMRAVLARQMHAFSACKS